MQAGWGSLMWFVAVIAMIPVALWLLKRTPLGGASALPGAPRAVAVLPLSPQQKVITVEVGQGEDRQWLVLGVSPQGIRTLHTMAALGDAPAPLTGGPSFAGPAAPFGQLLSRLRRDGGATEQRNAR
ncbi:MAG TPA: flagellar biosynthetic protein FliO [Rubrivivax sp.]|nr:flagellar biosynthetic protein FliO [Rubrivivax sp.]